MEAAAPWKLLVVITSVCSFNKAAMLIVKKQTVMMAMPTTEHTAFQLSYLWQHIAVGVLSSLCYLGSDLDGHHKYQNNTVQKKLWQLLAKLILCNQLPARESLLLSSI